jgi:hypothetical protein
MADSPTQEKVREAVATLQRHLNWLTNEQHEWVLTEGEIRRREAIRTLLAAFTMAEADLAEARKALTKIAAARVFFPLPSPPSIAVCEREETVDVALRALAAFRNKGEE